jgi:flagellar biosynthesis anti-sigma factor FlgM
LWLTCILTFGLNHLPKWLGFALEEIMTKRAQLNLATAVLVTSNSSQPTLQEKAAAALEADAHQAKLERIKAQIADGSYNPDSKNVASALIRKIEEDIFLNKFESGSK